MGKRVVIRADASQVIGSGHVMRCLTLAARLRRRGEDVTFVSRELPGNLIAYVEAQGFEVLRLPQHEADAALAGYAAWLTVPQATDAEETLAALRGRRVDLLVIDSYALDAAWEQRLRPHVGRIFVIDDLSNRVHDCDVLLDQNFYQDGAHRYDGLVPTDCRLLLGPQHALLREEFFEARRHLRQRDGQLRRVFVFYGGSDRTRETEKAVRALLAVPELHLAADVVVGSSNAHIAEVRALCDGRANLHLHVQAQNMAAIMAAADLALGAGGTTTWERCYLGLPALVTAIAENQFAVAADCGAAGLIRYLGTWTDVTEARLIEELRACARPEVLRELQRRCQLDVQADGDDSETFEEVLFT